MPVSTSTVPDTTRSARNGAEPASRCRPATLRDHPAEPVPWVAVRGPKARFLWERGAQQDQELHADALALVMHLASKLFATEDTVTITAEQLSALAHKSPATIATTMLHLERRGFVHRSGGGRRVPTTYRPMLPAALVRLLADNAEYEADRPEFARLLDAPAPQGVGAHAPDGSERPRQAPSSPSRAKAMHTSRAAMGGSPTPVSSVTGHPATLAPREVAWVRATLNRAAEILLDDAHNGAAEVEALRSHYFALRSQDRFCRQLLDLVAAPSGFSRTAGLIAGQRWTTTNPGALAHLISGASSHAGSLASPTGWPPGWVPEPDQPDPSWLTTIGEMLSAPPDDRHRPAA